MMRFKVTYIDEYTRETRAVVTDDATASSAANHMVYPNGGVWYGPSGSGTVVRVERVLEATPDDTDSTFPETP